MTKQHADDGDSAERLAPFTWNGSRALRSMTDSELVYAALFAAELDEETFAVEVLDVSPSRVRGWLTGGRRLNAAMRALCISIADRPSLAKEIIGERTTAI